ncbi:hypothetical protein BOTBODRAFT_189820 [Botryobasidium botryosum FD-172 SS1]|uniref:Uncharacterized protein n=1 Tax=Botryobasidium botryosum (strain FD-172 SS1) TaxID=930990 RepID=A0A067MIP8_BOTB1|nr:hypothetical protein BOTBODRAFT_189820 [Botryobasidium botryosum FD-172 SS1]
MSQVQTLTAIHARPLDRTAGAAAPASERAAKRAAVRAAEAALANVAAANAAAAQAAAANAAAIQAALADQALASATVAKPIAARGAIDVSGVEDTTLVKWLAIHHNSEEGAFLSVIQNKTGHAISWAYGPFILEINISFTGVTGEFGINIPLRGYKKLLGIDGDLISGISASFNIEVAKGHIRIYLRERQAIVELEASAFGRSWETLYLLLAL